MHCGLLGRKLSHSYSPQIHNYLGNYSYELFEIEPDTLKTFLKTADFRGINVTIPYKKDVIPFCDALSLCAEKVGAVNTIIRNPDGKLIGYNTDYYGFQSMVKKSGLSLKSKKVLILGSGGASATASVVLTELGANAVVISRNGTNNYTNLSRHQDASAIINCTPVGMYPNTDSTPIDLNLFPNLEGVLDLVYNPANTYLLQQARARKLICENGLWMLVAQAKKAAELFTDSKIDDAIIADIHRQLQNQMKNLVLVGMPGCGKTTIGKLLAEKAGRTFVDTDEQIERLAGIPIPAIFTEFGENHFRSLETAVLSQFGKESGLIISTGGGCVTRQENYAHLHQNGTIIWLQRDLQKLATDGRPLSATGKLSVLYQQRLEHYKQFADIIIDNNGDTSTTVQQIEYALEDI